MSVTYGHADIDKVGQILVKTIISDSEDNQNSDSDREEKHVPEDNFQTLIKSEVENGDESSASGSENNPDGYSLEESIKNRKTFDRPCAQATMKSNQELKMHRKRSRLNKDVSLAVPELAETESNKKLPQRKAREKGRKFLLALLKNEKEDFDSDNGEVEKKTDISKIHTERKTISRKMTPEAQDKIKLKPGRKLSHSSMKIGPSGARRKKRISEMTEEEREKVRAQWKEQKLRQRKKLDANQHPTSKINMGKKNVPQKSAEEYRAKLAEHSRRRRQRMAPEKKVEYLRKAKEYKKRRLALMTPDQRREMRQGWTIRKLEKIAKMTEEEKSAYEFQQFTKRLERRFRLRERRQIEWDSLTEAEKEERIEKRRRYARERWRDPKKKAAMMECSKRAREKLKKDPEKLATHNAKLKLINRSYKMKRALGQLPWQQEGSEETGHGHRWGCRKYPNESEAEREKREKEMRRQRGGRSKQAEVGGECLRKSNPRNETQEERENRLMKARISRAKNILRKRLVADGALPEEVEAKLKEVASSAKSKDKQGTSKSQTQNGDQDQIPLEVQSSKTNDPTNSQIIVLEIAPPRPYTDTPSTEISSFSFVPASPSPTDFEVVIEPPGQPFLQFHFQTPIDSDSTFALSQTLPEAFCLFDAGNTQDAIPHIIPNFCFTVEDKQVECTASDNNNDIDNQSILISLPCTESDSPDHAADQPPEIPNTQATVTAPSTSPPPPAASVNQIKKVKKVRRAVDPSKLKRATSGPRGSRTKSADVEDDPKLMIVCHICGLSYKSTYFKDHLRFQHNPNYKDGTCLLCGGTYTNSKTFRRHFVSVHMEKVAKDKDKPYMCPDCGHSYALESNLRSHIYYRHGEGLKSQNYFKCEHCPKSFKMEMGYRKHLKFVHPEHHKDKKTVKHLACNTCDKVCPTQLEFLEHFKGAHPELECHPCKFCSAVCFTTAGLLFHYYNCRKLHSRGEARKLMKEFPSDILRIVNAKLNCECCKRECVSASLSRHYFEVHGIKEQRSFYCWLCPKVFKVRDFLVYHLIDRHGLQWTEELRRKVAKVVAEEGFSIQNPDGKVGGIEGNTKKKQKIIEKRIAEGRPPRRRSTKKEEGEDKTKAKRSRGRPKKGGSEVTNFPTTQARVSRKKTNSARKPASNENRQDGKDKRLTSLTSQEGDPKPDKCSDFYISNNQVKTEHDIDGGESDCEIEKKKRLVIELERVKIEDIDYFRSFSPPWVDLNPTVKEEESSD